MEDDMIKFLKFKNKLLREAGASIDLVPEDQMIALPQFDWKTFHENIRNADHTACPYCFEFWRDNSESHCAICPMAINGNKCGDKHSTYSVVLNEIASNEDTEIFENSEIKMMLEDFIEHEIIN